MSRAMGWIGGKPAILSKIGIVVTSVCAVVGCLSDASLDTPGGSLSSGRGASGEGASGSGAAPGDVGESDPMRLTGEGLDAALKAPENVFAPPGDAEYTDSGLASLVLVQGDGQRFPGPSTTVRVHYTGWQTDGTMFDSSVERGEPSQLQLSEVIAGWTEGLQLMVEGEQRRFWIPAELAYLRFPDRPQGMLVFDVQLIQIIVAG